MGQSPSRQRDSTISAPPSQCVPNHNRRFKRGRNLLKLVKPSSRSTNGDNTRRRSWFGRPSRPISTLQPTSPTTVVSRDSCSGQSSASSAPTSPSISTPQTSPQNYRPMDKGSVVEVSSLEAPGGPSGVDVLAQAAPLSRRPSQLEPSQSAGPCPPEDSNPSVIPPVQEEIPPTPLSSHPSSPSERVHTHPAQPSPSTNSNAHQTLNPQTTPPARQFPPPGTLVLVQGVVQTTDVPRPPNADNVTETNSARPRSPSEPANGSSLSSSGSRPTSAALPSEIIEHAEHDSTSHESSADPATPTHIHEQPATSAPDSEARSSPATPPNGVEVLGTLLSVAAAATAASLLAGSAENILSPTRPNATPSRTGELPDLSLNARRERMRHAWQSVRERLGLRPSAPSTALPADGQQVDAREVMLAEMARAFNLGLGISPDSEEANTTTQPAAESEPSRPLSPPAPGSFEQFLADLQSDLRGVLNEAEGPARPEVEEEETESPATETSSTVPEPTVEEPSSAESTSENGQDVGSRNVNWWRMYRFPQMSARNGVPTLASSPVESPTEPRSASPASPTTDASPSNVVPVVVVGLRSVNVPGQLPTPEVPAPAPVPSPTESEPMPGSWPSRAASALRNLRPGRRGEQREEAPVNAGSPRTFLIFVIGGYYPPDHSMVTGGENSLASFEALLELAEMLGQNKPQTASKDDIERSGLEIIKAHEIPKYEQEGKISSNCTDRCLICLDDYEPEDPVRIMTCRHGFHKTCVDRWLETGRNNCPACRSAGVSTDISAM